MIRIIICILVLLANISYADAPMNPNPGTSDNGMNSGIERKATTGIVFPQNGLGFENREKIETAKALILQQRKFEQAGVLLDEVIKAFETNYIKKDTGFVSFLDKNAFERYCTSSGKIDAVWLDWSYRDAYFFKAFMAVEQNNNELALQVLDKVISIISPDDPEALCEKGNIYNNTGRIAEGLEQYLHAYELTKEINSYKHYMALALRGMGFSYIELGKLQEAEEAYTESLKLEPNNSIAISELRYINHIKPKIQNK